jgi:hypothetical protein
MAGKVMAVLVRERRVSRGKGWPKSSRAGALAVDSVGCGTSSAEINESSIPSLYDRSKSCVRRQCATSAYQ